MITRIVRARGRAIALVLVAAHAVRAVPLVAQQPPSQPPPQLAPYRAPVISLVQPSGGGTVPQDKPVVVFRFAPGEPADPLDVASFRVAVDGLDQSARFQVAASEAWGALGVPSSGDAAEGAESAIAAGMHQVLARICSSRGACAEASAMVTVVPIAVKAAVEERTGEGRKARVIDALLAAVKKILSP